MDTPCAHPQGLHDHVLYCPGDMDTGTESVLL
jgi:hypothetical protein